MTAPQVVPLTEDWLEAVAELEQLCFSTPWSRQALASELDNPQAVYLAALQEGRLLGYGGMRFAAGEFYVDNIAVAPCCRRQGIGRLIVTALLEEARARDGCFLSLEVRASNQAALALYKGLGFCQAGRRKNFYTRPTEDALIMTYWLEEPAGKEDVL